MITLGQASNYSFGQVWRHTFAWGTKRDSERLRAALAEKYGTQPESVALYHTGRSALAAALQAVAPEGGAKVIIPGLTCIAVVRAVRAAGCEPVFVDIEPKNLEYNYEKLEAKLTECAFVPASAKASFDEDSELRRPAEGAEQKGSLLPFSKRRVPRKSDSGSQTAPENPIDKSDDVCYNRTIILIQNTLGIPWHASKIEKLAKKYHATIVEDLAHSAGRIYSNGRAVGTVGAAAALSFGKGKAIDTISGGALVVRSNEIISRLSSRPESCTSQPPRCLESSIPQPSPHQKSCVPPSPHCSKSPILQPSRRPKLSDRLRDRFYPLFGAISRGLCRVKLGAIFMGGLVKIRFVQRSADAELDLSRRLTHWQAKLALRQLSELPETRLRDFRLVENRPAVLSDLRRQGYYLEEIWYDTPVSPRRYAEEADFPATDCPMTVEISQQIINLPTWYPENRLAKAYEIIKPSEISPKQKTTSTQPSDVVSPRMQSSAKSSSDTDHDNRKHAVATIDWQEALKSYSKANFLQSPAWGKANELVGHKVIIEYNLTDEDSHPSEEPHYWCQMIVKDAKRGRYLEIPGGPLLDWNDDQAKKLVFQKIRQIAEREKCVFVRLRPQLRVADIDKISGLNLRKAPMHLHAEHTIILDLTKSEDQLLAEMRRQTRYEVRRADKLGIQVEWSHDEELFKEFHAVQAETAARQHFVPPNLAMLLAERSAFGDSARLYVARTEAGRAVAYGLILISGDEAEYFEAASTELNYKLPGAYALQWRVIRDLKALGLKRYNLWGIAPPNQPDHRYAKVTTFKKGFGGEIVEFIPAQDLIIKKSLYQIDFMVETLRKKVRHL